jgi:hypothetical protein
VVEFADDLVADELFGVLVENILKIFASLQDV